MFPFLYFRLDNKCVLLPPRRLGALSIENIRYHQFSNPSHQWMINPNPIYFPMISSCGWNGASLQGSGNQWCWKIPRESPPANIWRHFSHQGTGIEDERTFYFSVTPSCRLPWSFSEKGSQELDDFLKYFTIFEIWNDRVLRKHR